MENNKLGICKACGKQIAKSAKVCPFCGAKNKKPIYKRIWFWILTIIILVIIISNIGGKKTTNTPIPIASTSAAVNTNAGTTKAPAATAKAESTNIFNLGDTLKTDTVSIAYTKAEEWSGYNEFSKPAEGNKVIRLFFEIENVSNTDQSIGSVDFNCYADGAAAANYYYASDAMTSIVTLSSGRKLSGWVYFEVPKKATTIEVEYETNFWTSKKAIFTVKL